MARHTFDPAGLRRWLEAKARAARYPDLTPALKVVRQLLVSETKQNFQLSRDPVDSSAWLPLKRERTRNKKKGGASKPLLDTGVLRASLSGGAQSVDEVRRDGLTYGTAVVYGRFHQKGTKHIPRRRFLGIGPVLSARIRKVLSDFMAKQLAK